MKLKMSPLVDDAAGKDGSLVIRRSRSGPVATPRTYPKQTVSARASAAKKNLGQSSSEFTNLSDVQILAWNNFGASRSKTNDVNGQKYAQTGINAYNELTTVFKMASPGTASPASPPTSSFSGDSLTFTTTASTGHITVGWTAVEVAGMKLEIMLQPLKSRARRIQKEGFVSAGFFALAEGEGDDATVPVPAGIYAVAVRYVKTATGQATVPQILGRVTVALSLADGGVDQETGEVLEPAAKPRMKKAA